MLRGKRFDSSILLQNAFEAALLVWLAGIPVRIGYARDGRTALLTHPIQTPRPGEGLKHQRFYYLELLKRAAIVDSYSENVQARLVNRVRQGRDRLRLKGIEEAVIGVSPGAAFGGAKRYLPERFAEAAAKIAVRLDATVLVFGSQSEAVLGEEVAAMIEQRSARAYNFAGKTTLAEFIDLASACRVLLTNDSGSMHLASALGVPVAVVFGPTDEFATGPAGERNAILREPVECAPCHLRECPIDHRCMTRVPAERLAEAALTLLP